ncbi:MAG: sensor histidine kinase [Bacilli bacterium]
MIWIMIGCICIASYALLRFFHIRKELKYVHMQMKRNSSAYLELRTNSLDKEIEHLVSDINELYKQKNQLRNEKNQRENALKEAMTNMAHDVRTPLTAIRGYSNLLIGNEDNQEKVQRYATIISERTAVLEHLIEEMFELALLDAGAEQVHFTVVNLSSSLEQSLLAFFAAFEERNIEPEIEITPNISLISDETMFNRICSNLLSNCLKYAHSQVTVSLKEVDKILVLVIRNDMTTEEYMDTSRLFERFYTGNKSRANNATGLGLAITAKLVEHLQGEISANVQGNTFEIKVELKTQKNLKNS